MKRPVLGRAGAGALILVAVVAVAQACSAGAVRAHAQVIPPPAAAPTHTTTPAAPLARAEMPQPEPARPVVPVGRDTLRVPILMYHYIRVNPVPGDQLGFNLSVTPEDFRAQMDWLAANGFHPIDFEDLRAYFGGRAPLPAKPVILTFDDGYKDLYTTAYPVLRAHGFKAVAYVVLGFLGAPNNVNGDQVREMDAHGIQIGSHTVSHADLTKTNGGELEHQVRDARAGLEALLGHPVLDFCYPAGRYDGRVVAAVQSAGYDTATTTNSGVAHNLGDRYTWTRVRVSGGERLPDFIASLGDPEATVTPAIDPQAPPHLPRLPTLTLVFPLQGPASRPLSGFGRARALP